MSIIADVSEHIAKGDRIRTNGDGIDRIIPHFLYGEVLKVGRNFFWLGHNDPLYQGSTNIVNPTEHGWKYVWCIGLSNRNAEISESGLVDQTEGVGQRESCSEDCNPTNVSFLSIQVNDQKTNPMSIFKLMSVALRRVLSPSMREQVKAGFRNEKLTLTGQGRSELLELLAEKYDEQFTARAKEVAAQNEVESNGSEE